MIRCPVYCSTLASACRAPLDAFDFVDYGFGHQAPTPFGLENQAGYRVQSSICPDGIPNVAAGDPPSQYPPSGTIIFDADGPPASRLESGCRVIEAEERRSRRQRYVP
jgi:hypothetical protein